MSAPSACPDERLLRDFAAGLLDPAAATAVREHLARCPACRSVADHLPSTVAQPIQPFAAAGIHTVEEESTVGLGGDKPKQQTEDPLDDFLFFLPSPNAEAKGRIGDYDVMGVVGRGGMGVVFKAFDAALHRTVAIKVLSPQLATSKQAHRRFLREGRAAAGISHPNVVTIHRVDEQAGMPFLVMEHVQGHTLRQRMRQQPALDLAGVLRIGAEVAAGLAAAHQQGVIHRDIKPANILLEEGVERVKISDFGLALVALDASDGSSAERAVGTPAYMSPEQVRGERADPRSDLFGLGCVLYAMVTGKSPFHGSHALEVARKVSDYVPEPLHRVDPAVPKFLSDIVRRLIEKRPRDRYQSAGEVHDLLQHHLACVRAEQSDVRFGTAPARRARRWHPLTVAALAALIVFLAALGAARLWKSSPVQELTVSQEAGAAPYDSIMKALADAKPGAIIRVLDDAVYYEAIYIHKRAQHQNVTLVADRRATIVPPKGQFAAVVIKRTPGVTVRGFRLNAGQAQHNLSVHGDCSDLSVDDVVFEQPPESGWANVLISEGACGSPENPIRLLNCLLNSGKELGLVMQESEGGTVADVVVENNRFTGPGTNLFLNQSVRDVVVRGNVFVGGVGVDLQPDGPEPQNIRIVNNTFFDTSTCWLRVSGKARQVDICNNLVLAADSVECREEDLARFTREWRFRNNWWEVTPARKPRDAELVAKLQSKIDVLSRDPAHSDFLRPPPGSPLLEAGVGGELPKYVGALLPPGASASSDRQRTQP